MLLPLTTISPAVALEKDDPPLTAHKIGPNALIFAMNTSEEPDDVKDTDPNERLPEN